MIYFIYLFVIFGFKYLLIYFYFLDEKEDDRYQLPRVIRGYGWKEVFMRDLEDRECYWGVRFERCYKKGYGGGYYFYQERSGRKYFFNKDGVKNVWEGEEKFVVDVDMSVKGLDFIGGQVENDDSSVGSIGVCESDDCAWDNSVENDEEVQSDGCLVGW